MAIYTRRNAITFCAVWLVGGMLLVGEKDDAGLAGSLAAADAPPASVAADGAGPSFSISHPVAQPSAVHGVSGAWEDDGGVGEIGTVPARAAPEDGALPHARPQASAPGTGDVVIAASYRGQSAPLPADQQRAARAALSEDLRRALP